MATSMSSASGVLILISATLLAAADPPSSLIAFIEAEMRTGGIPGLSAAAINSTHVLWAQGFGYSDPEVRKPVGTDTLFTFASISKTVISFVAMQLYDRKLFGLDDDVNDYLSFPLRNPHFPSVPITMRMLMSHTSSIDDTQYFLSLIHI